MLPPVLFTGTPKDLSNNTKYFIKRKINFKQSLPQKFISKSNPPITVSIRQTIAWLKLHFSSKNVTLIRGGNGSLITRSMDIFFFFYILN